MVRQGLCRSCAGKSSSIFNNSTVPDLVDAILQAGCKASPTTPPKRAARNPADVTHDKGTVTAEAVAKRNWDASAPDYLKDINGQESVFYFPGACSCLITSPSPVSTSTTTQTIPRYTGTTTVTTTFVDNFTVTVTPRSTTTYVSRN